MAAHLQPGVYMRTCHWLDAFGRLGGACARRVSNGRQDFSCLHCQVTLQTMQSQMKVAHDQTACQLCKQSRIHARDLQTKEWGCLCESDALVSQ